MLVKILIALPIVAFVAFLAYSSIKTRHNPTDCCSTKAKAWPGGEPPTAPGA